MPALNFQKKFAPDVKSGKKKQTIRLKRKNPIKEGDTLYLYTGMRTKSCEKLREVKCDGVLDFKIYGDGLTFEIGQTPVHHNDSMNRIAIADGFKDWREMVQWFSKTHGLPFEGDLILWK